MRRKSSTLYLIPSCMAIPCLLSKPKHKLLGCTLEEEDPSYPSASWSSFWEPRFHSLSGTSFVFPNYQKDNVASPHTAMYNKETHHNIPRAHSLLDDRWMLSQSTNFQIANYPGWRQGFLLAFVRDMKTCNSPVRSHNLRFKTSKENCTESGGQRLLLWLTTE